MSAYRDTLGNWTIGYGHTPASEGQTISESQANNLLTIDLYNAQSDLKASLSWSESALSVCRYCVLWNMTFNMGIDHLLEFHLMLAAVRNKDWDEASRQMLDSLWARQVKDRAIELADQMKTGSWFNPET